MQDPDLSDSDHLNDTELLALELKEREVYRRLKATEPRLRDTTYGVRRGSPALIASWDRWWLTHVEARMRGLLTRVKGP